MNFFTEENKDLHMKVEQVKSQGKAVSEIKPKDITANPDGSYTFQGKSGTHIVTIDSCDCSDFINNKKKAAPCKHIYRIAIDTGLFSMPQYDPKAAKELKAQIPAELEKWKAAYLSGALKAEAYVKIVEALSK